VHLANVPETFPAAAADLVDTYVSIDEHRFALKKMGVMTALAIGIHNLPEGLATFVAALVDPLNGVAIAVAIALHNIPEVRRGPGSEADRPKAEGQGWKAGVQRRAWKGGVGRAGM